MNEQIKTVTTDTPDGRVLEIWVGRDGQLTRIPGRLDNAILVTHDMGADSTVWRISVAEPAKIDQLLPTLMEVLKRFCAERNVELAAKTEVKNLAKPVRTGQTSIPLPKGMTPEQVKEFSQSINAFRTNSLGKPPA